MIKIVSINGGSMLGDIALIITAVALVGSIVFYIVLRVIEKKKKKDQNKDEK